MGNATSPSQISKNTINMVSQYIAETIQSSNPTANLSQAITLNCTRNREILGKALIECLQQFANRPDRNKICEAFLNTQCELVNVDLSQFVNITFSSEQKNQIITNIENKFNSSLESKISDEYKLFNIGGQTSQNLQNLSTLTAKILTENIQFILSSISGRQSIQVTGGFVELVSLQQTITNFSKILQQNDSFMRAVNDVTVSIKSDLQNQNKTLNLILYIGIAIVGVILIIVILIIALRKLKKRA